MLERRLGNQKNHKIETTAARESRGSMYCKRHTLSYNIQIEVKLILDQTSLEDESNHINYRPIGRDKGVMIFRNRLLVNLLYLDQYVI